MTICPCHPDPRSPPRRTTQAKACPELAEGDPVFAFGILSPPWRKGIFCFAVGFISLSFTRVKTTDEPAERLTLESNAVEFDILPADAGWAAEEQSKFDQVLRTQPADSPAWRDALKRLARLGTAESAESLVQLYLSNEGKQRPWEIDYEIRESLHPEIVIRALLSALSNPSLDPPASISQLLADLETRNKLGAPPAYPREQTPEWKAKLEERQKTHQEYLQQANDLLLASAQERSGENRAAAIFQVWSNAEGLKQTAGVSQESLERLRNAVLSVRDELPLNLQQQLASAGWHSFPHAQLLPLVRKFAKESLDRSAFVGYQYLGQWCQEEEEPCNQAIIEAAQQPGPKTYKPAVLLLTESEHPELDGLLREELRSPEMGRISADAVTMAALVLRAGSENLLPDVLQRLDRTFPSTGYDCELRADLLGYMFRFNAKQGAKRLSATLQSTNDRCAGQLLRALNTDRYSDDLIPPAMTALQSANVAAVGSAALFLAEHGPGGTEETIMKRLDALHEIWRDRASELDNPQLLPQDQPQREASQAEQELASALVRGRNWKLSPPQVDHVHSTCLTEQCRSIAEGKMSLGF